MSVCLSEKLLPLECKTHLKNIHSIRNVKVYDNEEILIIYESCIHIYSLRRIAQSLPSLVYVIDLVSMLGSVGEQTFQDKLSKQILETEKNDLGKVIFNQKLNPEDNVFMKMNSLEERLKFLSSQNPSIQSLQINEQGHILVLFEDYRCLFIRRTVSQTFSQSYVNLYDVKNSLCLNTVRNSQIFGVTFMKVKNSTKTMLVWLQNSKAKNEGVNCEIGEVQIKEEVVTLSEEGKKQKIKKLSQIKKSGFISLFYSQSNQFLFLSYYNEVRILQISKERKISKGKKAQWQISFVKTINFQKEFNKEYILSYHYFDEPSFHFFVATSQKMLRIQLDGKNQRIQQVAEFEAKTNPILVNNNGYYIQGQGNRMFSVQTENGIIIQIESSLYSKEGLIKIYYCPLKQILSKIALTIKNKKPLNLNDIHFLFYATKGTGNHVKKQFLNDIFALYKTLKPAENQEVLIEDVALKNSEFSILLINILSIFQSKPDLVIKLMSQKIHQKCRISLEMSKNHCYWSGEEIVLDDVSCCPRCNLYAKKEKVHEKSDICYICHNKLIDIC